MLRFSLSETNNNGMVVVGIRVAGKWQGWRSQRWRIPPGTFDY